MNDKQRFRVWQEGKKDRIAFFNRKAKEAESDIVRQRFKEQVDIVKNERSDRLDTLIDEEREELHEAHEAITLLREGPSLEERIRWTGLSALDRAKDYFLILVNALGSHLAEILASALGVILVLGLLEVLEIGFTLLFILFSIFVFLADRLLRS